MTLQYVNEDLFNAPQGYYLVHCISGDYTLGAGLAEKINEIYDMRYKLHKQYPTVAFSDTVGCALVVDNVFNLVDKVSYKDKASLLYLEEALLEMKCFCESINITKIAMPKIGCGKDRLNWEEVKDLIESIFDDTDIDIRVYVKD